MAPKAAQSTDARPHQWRVEWDIHFPCPDKLGYSSMPVFLVHTGPGQPSPIPSLLCVVFGVKAILGIGEVRGASQCTSSQTVQITDLFWECHYSLLALTAEFSHEKLRFLWENKDLGEMREGVVNAEISLWHGGDTWASRGCDWP